MMVVVVVVVVVVVAVIVVAVVTARRRSSSLLLCVFSPMQHGARAVNGRPAPRLRVGRCPLRLAARLSAQPEGPRLKTQTTGELHD